MLFHYLRKYIFKTVLLLGSTILISFIAYINMFPDGYIAVIGDMSQIFRIEDFISKRLFLWDSDVSSMFTWIVYYYPLSIIQRVFSLNTSQQSFYYHFVFLFGSFWSFYYSIRIINNKQQYINILFSVFYMINCYSLFYNYLSGWGRSPFLFLYLLIPLIFSNLYVYSNIANSNMAYFISLNIFILIFITTLMAINKKIYIKKMILFYCVYYAVILVSVLPQLVEMININKTFKSGGSVWDLGAWIIWQAVSLKNILYFQYVPYVNTWGFIVAGILPLMLLSLLLLKNKIIDKLSLILLVCVIFCVFFLNKGKGLLSDNLIKYIFTSNPIFSSLRSFDKNLIFLPFFVLMVSCMGVLKIKNKTYKFITVLILLLAISYPSYYFISGKIKKIISSDYNYRGRVYCLLVKIPEEYFRLSENSNYEKLDSKVLNMPYGVINSKGWVNYPKWKLVGSDPIPSIFDKGFIGMNNVGHYFNWNYGEYWNEQNDRESEWLAKFCGILNCKELIYHKDVHEKFLEQTKGKILFYENKNIINIIDKNPFFNYYSLNDEYYLPHVYTAEDIICVNKNIEEIPRILSKGNYKVRSAIYFDEVKYLNDKKINVNSPDALSIKSAKTTPVLEYKKINPVKYRIRIHGAQGEFPVILSEKYNDNWRMYIRPVSNFNMGKNIQLLGKYKILKGNAKDRATIDELKDYINKGWVTELGDGKDKLNKHKKWNRNIEVIDNVEKYNIDFVSGNIKGTIQNNNLDDGKLYETWFAKPFNNNKTHKKVNGYANSWDINVNKISDNNLFYIENSDGSRDLEVVLEYWPQRLFYLGLIISGAIFLFCLLYLSYGIFKYRKYSLTESRVAVIGSINEK